MYIFLAILLFSLLVFIHELGHFVTAKLSGVQVNEFSMFMGPALWKKQVGETLYAIRLIPLGGYCAMEGEDEDSDNPRSFGKAAWWKRMIILVAGAAMNFLLGVVIFGILFFPSDAVAVPEIREFSDCCTFAGEDGLMLGDRIVEIDGEAVYLNSDISLLLGLNSTGVHDITVERNGETIAFRDYPMGHTHLDEEGREYIHYGFGFGVEKKLDFGGKLKLVWDVTRDNVRNVRLSLQMLLTGRAKMSDMAGPVGIVQMMSDTAESSATTLDALMNVLYFGGFLSVNLAVMNLLPIPALDGGRAVCLLLTAGFEKLSGRKLDPKYEGYLHGAGMILLLGFMALVTFKDIFNIFRG